LRSPADQSRPGPAHGMQRARTRAGLLHLGAHCPPGRRDSPARRRPSRGRESSSLMRILFYNHAAEISGAERSLLSIMHGARAAGHTVTLCAPPGALAESAACGHIALEPIAPLVLGYPRHPFALLRYLGGVVAPVAGLRRAIRRSRPDIVHANSIRGGLIAAVALRLVRPGPELLVHMRDALCPTLVGRLVARIIG